VRACLSILELCELFRDSSQASGASQRVQRASVARPRLSGRVRASEGPAHHGSRAAAAGVSLCALVVRHSPSRSGFTTLACAVRVRLVIVFVSSVLCAARGQRVLRGTEWTLCAPTGLAARSP